jgi:MFS family permease
MSPGDPSDADELSLLDEPEVVFDPFTDPGGASLGVTGSEASVDLAWPKLLRHRVQTRARRSPRYQWWVLSALLAGLLSLNITFTVFVVALPTVAKEFNTSYSVLTWTSTGPLLAFGLAAPLFGKWGDLFGHRRLYMFGLFGAMVSAVLTATAPDVGVLLFARILDGVQGAATGTASMAIILRMFAPEDRVKAMGWWSMVGAGGPVIGVTIGSLVIGALGWRALFWGQLGLLVISMMVVALILPAHGKHSLEVEGAEPPPSRWQAIDWVGTWSLSAVVAGSMLALSIGPLYGWTSPGVLVPAALSVMALGLFVYRERTAEHPLIPVAYFRRRNFMLPMGARAFGNFAYFGAFFLFPLLMEEVYGWKVAAVGLLSIARPICFSVSSPIAGYLAPRLGERFSATFGMAAVTGSMVLFASTGPSPQLFLLVLALCLAGTGMGVASPSTSSIQSSEVDPSEFGVMSAAQLLAVQVGEVVGIQVSVTVLEAHTRHLGLTSDSGPALLPTFHLAFWVGAVVAAVGTVCAAFIRNLPRPGLARASGRQ